MNAMTWLMVVVPVVALLAAVAGYLGGHFGARAVATRTLADAQGRANGIVDDAKRLDERGREDAGGKMREADDRARDAETKIRSVELEAKEMALKARAGVDQESRVRQRELQELERRVAQQEEQIGRRLD